MVAKLRDQNTAMTVNYVPTANTEASVVIPSANNGGATERTFTQASVGSQNRMWYVLSTDDEGVNIVSTETAQNVTFQDSAGYDNCLYYLDKISKDLFTNESQYGVTRDRVHALNLTDIKKAAEQLNSGVKVSERDWSWETDFLGSSLLKAETSKVAFRDSADYTSSGYTYYPAIYEADGSGVVTCNNLLYDEEVMANPITTDSGIKRSETNNPANKLTVYNTAFSFNNRSDCLTALGKGTTDTFGNSKLADSLFSSGTGYWLASRSVSTNSSCAEFNLRYVSDGRFTTYGYLCSSGGSGLPNSSSMRVVVSIPASHINVASDGTVSLK